MLEDLLRVHLNLVTSTVRVQVLLRAVPLPVMRTQAADKGVFPLVHVVPHLEVLKALLKRIFSPLHPLKVLKIRLEYGRQERERRGREVREEILA